MYRRRVTRRSGRARRRDTAQRRRPSHQPRSTSSSDARRCQRASPEYIVASFDCGSTFRDDLVSDYRPNRTRCRNDSRCQIPLVLAACERRRADHQSERFRADERARDAGDEGRRGPDRIGPIVTGDKDFFKIVHEGVRVLNPRERGDVVRRARRQREGWPRSRTSRWSTCWRDGHSIENQSKACPGLARRGRRS